MHPHRHKASVLRSYAGLLLVTVCCFALEYAPQPMFNTISREFGSSRAATGLLVGVYMLSLSVSPLFVGVLLGRVGIRRTIFWASVLLGASGAGILLADSFAGLLAVRIVQALLAPPILTAVMSAITVLFRHLDLNRALAGYITINLVGSLTGRLAGGWGAELFGWRETIVFFCLLFFLTLPITLRLPRMRPPQANKGLRPRLADYPRILALPGVATLLLAEAAGVFVFTAVGNLLPFRMAELGRGDSDGLVGLMYTGYAIGLVASLILAPLKRLLKTQGRVLIGGALIYAVFGMSLAAPTLWVIFAGIWGMAFGQFVIHAMSPGLVNVFAARGAARAGIRSSRAMVNGLYLSCFYFGAFLGSILPGMVYSHFGWGPCYAWLQADMILVVILVWRLKIRMPELN